MSELAAIAYVSSASMPLDEDALEALLVTARSRNEELGITGALLYHDGSFFQYLEGPADSVRAVYERIQASPLHRGLIQLLSRRIDHRHFDGWSMGFARVPHSLVLKLAQASWIEVVSKGREAAEQPAGVKLLLEFWRHAERR